MNPSLIIITGLFILAIVSGMLGLGVGFAAIPFLGLFLPDLVNQVQPLSLLLNGVTAALAVFGFAKSGYVDWKKAIPLAVITILSPIGAYLAHFLSQIYIWIVYFVSVIYLVYRLFKPAKEILDKETFKLALILVVPISILAGFLGVGPGFLLMPTLIVLCFEPKKAAGINALAVTPPSFSSLLPHLSTAQLNMSFMIPLLLAGAIGSFMAQELPVSTSLALKSDEFSDSLSCWLLCIRSIH